MLYPQEIFLLAWNAGSVNSISHFLDVLKVPALVDHFVVLCLDFCFLAVADPSKHKVDAQQLGHCDARYLKGNLNSIFSYLFST